MGYIIVFRHCHREPHVSLNSHGFKDTFSTEEEAKSAAEQIIKDENKDSTSPWYFDYAIYQEC